MEISIQEVHSYLNLVNEGRAEKINCPLNETDTVISKIDESNKVFFSVFLVIQNFIWE